VFMHAVRSREDEMLGVTQDGNASSRLIATLHAKLDSLGVKGLSHDFGRFTRLLKAH